MNLVFKYRVTEFTELDAGLTCMSQSEYCNCYTRLPCICMIYFNSLT